MNIIKKILTFFILNIIFSINFIKFINVMEFFNKLKATLLRCEKFVDNNNELSQQKVIEVVRRSDSEDFKNLINLLLNDEAIKKEFFIDVDSALIFDKEKFISYLKNKEFLDNSYTKFDNKIGFNIDKQLEDYVVLNFPYKDCILEGGQSNSEKKREEIFFNEILAKDEISRLFEPKVLTNFEKYNQELLGGGTKF